MYSTDDRHNMQFRNGPSTAHGNSNMLPATTASRSDLAIGYWLQATPMCGASHLGTTHVLETNTPSNSVLSKSANNFQHQEYKTLTNILLTMLQTDNVSEMTRREEN